MSGDWTAVVPVKGFGAAKSRLDLLPTSDSEIRLEIARALALDTVAAIRTAEAVARVVVVTPDPEVAALMRGAGVEIVADPGAGLNAAVLAGAAEHIDVVAVLGDLPSLTATALDAVIIQVQPGERAHVADRSGEGTTMLLARGVPLAPEFGAGSAAAHAASGSRELHDVPEGVRLDVDTLDDLVAAARVGVGAHTARWLGVALAGATQPEPDQLQATVRTWSAEGGTAFLDDGTVVPLVGDARNWRPGQRVRLHASPDGRWLAAPPG